MFTDPISDMLTRIRHASQTRKADVLMPFSKMKYEIAKILKHENYIEGFEKVEQGTFANLKIDLKYQDDKPVINHLKRISTPGRRVYVKKEELPKVLDGFGVAILSTPQGLMTNKQAKRVGVGGEVICEVY